MKLKTLLQYSSAQFEKLSTAEKMTAVRHLEQVANKRIERLKEEGLEGASYAYNMRSGKKFKTRMPSSPGMVRKHREANLNKRLTEAYGQAKDFLSSSTSTIKGASKTYSRASRDFVNYDEFLNATEHQKKKFWEAYNKLKKDYPDLMNKGALGYEKRREQLFQIMTYQTKRGIRFKGIDQAVNQMGKMLDQEYKENAKKFLSD